MEHLEIDLTSYMQAQVEDSSAEYQIDFTEDRAVSVTREVENVINKVKNHLKEEHLALRKNYPRSGHHGQNKSDYRNLYS